MFIPDMSPFISMRSTDIPSVPTLSGFEGIEDFGVVPGACRGLGGFWIG
jgi:hypothetical protein